jgi:site-specific recombinase XerD
MHRLVQLEGSLGKHHATLEQDGRSWLITDVRRATSRSRTRCIAYVWHCNRHNYCSWLAMAEASIKEIQEAAGHKSITMSARYSHLSPEHKLSVVERIASVSK